MTKKRKLGIFLLVLPYAVSIINTSVAGIMQLIFSGSYAENGAIAQLLNIVIFVVGALGVLSMLPLTIVGIVFIVQGGKKTDKENNFNVS